MTWGLNTVLTHFLAEHGKVPNHHESPSKPAMCKCSFCSLTLTPIDDRHSQEAQPPCLHPPPPPSLIQVKLNKGKSRRLVYTTSHNITLIMAVNVQKKCRFHTQIFHKKCCYHGNNDSAHTKNN